MGVFVILYKESVNDMYEKDQFRTMKESSNVNKNTLKVYPFLFIRGQKPSTHDETKPKTKKY